MNRRFDAYLLGWLMLLTTGFLCAPLAAAVAFGDPKIPFLGAIGVAVVGGLILTRLNLTTDRSIQPRDGFLVVGGAWVVVSLIGAVPYLLAGALGPADALFESVSGFTTTGSTTIADTSVIAPSLLLWRAMTQWIGGMGIILFTIAILPLLGIGGMQLFKAEVPGPVADKVQPRLANTARSLWGIYVGLTAAEWLALRLAGVSGFEALCHAFTTLATGGFSTRNTSIGEFGSPTVEWIIIIFMLMAGTNFVLHYRMLVGRVREVARDAELRYFLSVAVVATILLAIVIHTPSARPADTIRTAAFQTVSLLTTTGYVTTDFELWPHLAILAVLVLLVLGGMSGSTGGGIKSLRALLALRSLRATLHRLIHPHAIRPVKYGGEVVPEVVLSGIWGFLTAYGLIALGGAAVVAAYGYDIVTALSASLTAIGNVGPGLGHVGAYDNFAHCPSLVKIVLSACMLFGRLEIFTLLAMCSREFWRR
ncbi:MAG: TrkH family potassium uptake protein [Acidobacteria bacterium]|nr:TrkH family potassium uptake protein [Acidobacteriota bacterium]